MIYNYTLLKDLPDYEKGTIFKVELTGKYTIINGAAFGGYGDIRPLINNEKWFNREIDTKSLDKLKCPKCNGTKGVLYTKEHIEYDDGVKYTYLDLYNECICGKHYKIKRLFSHSRLY